MATAFVPPWVVPPDFLGFMRAGSEAGIQASRTAQAAREAAERTRLGYAQLGQQANSDMARIAANREAQAIQAAESLRGHGLRELALAQEQQNRVTDNERAAAALGLQERHQGMLERNEFRPRVENVGGALVEFDPRTGAAKELLRPNPAPGKMTEYDHATFNDALVRKRTLERDLNDPIKGINKAAIQQGIAEANEVIKRFAPVAPAPAATPAQAAQTVEPENYYHAGNLYDAPAHRAPVGLQPAPTPSIEQSLPAPGPNQVYRRTSDGRTAIFDATTKAFLRYAE